MPRDPDGVPELVILRHEGTAAPPIKSKAQAPGQTAEHRRQRPA
jgi:hypothetical protein